jgi:dihydrolipoamide dehydrogenase
LLHSAEVYQTLRHAADFGCKVEGEVSYDFAAVINRSRRVAEQLSNGVKFLFKKNKITAVMGTGRLAGKGRVRIKGLDGTESELLSRHIIVATGARARKLPGLEPDGDRVWTYKEAMVPKAMPKSLLVIGSGAIGIEFASFYRALGAEVTVVEILDRILPVEDAEICAFAAKAFERRGIRLRTKTTVNAISKQGSGVVATMNDVAGKTRRMNVERVILAIGIIGNVEGIGLENTDVKVEKGHIQVDPWCQTGEAGVYAIGDVVGPPWLAHKAMHEGVLCVEKIAGIKGVEPLDVSRVPACTYSHPQIASVGLTEAKAKENGHEVKIGRFPFIANGKAVALNDTEGMVKTVFDAQSGELLGAHMVGPDVTELIQGYGIARTLEATETELMETIFPHPTLSEAMHESVLDAYGRSLHF